MDDLKKINPDALSEMEKMMSPESIARSDAIFDAEKKHLDRVSPALNEEIPKTYSLSAEVIAAIRTGLGYIEKALQEHDASHGLDPDCLESRSQIIIDRDLIVDLLARSKVKKPIDLA